MLDDPPSRSALRARTASAAIPSATIGSSPTTRRTACSPAIPAARGREGVDRFAADTSENWAELQIIAGELRDLGDRVLALGRMEGRGKGSGVPVDQPFATVLDFRGDRIWRSRVYLDRAEEIRAAGLSE